MTVITVMSACSQFAGVFRTPAEIAPLSPIELTWFTNPPASLFGITGCGGPASGSWKWTNGEGTASLLFGFDGRGGCYGDTGFEAHYAVTYQKAGSESCTCEAKGTGSVPVDGEWHAVSASACQTPNGDAHGWTVMLSGVSSGVLAEGKMVADAGKPGSGNGPNLIVRAIPLKPCPPNCPPPDACLACVQAGHTIAECQASGACPQNCPPYCPPPPGCPEDPSKCPPPSA